MEVLHLTTQAEAGLRDPVIDTAGLRKVYRRKIAVADLTLQVPRGEVFGFLGPNGAGKSTAVKMLLGLVRPTGGRARVLGQPPGHIATLARIGFLPEHFRFHTWMRATELLDLHGRLYGMDPAARRRRIPELLALVGLTEAAQRPISAFSKGMIQRIGLAQALLNHPALVFLDEPTSALDPFGRMLVRTIIHELKAQGTTIFLNSHLLGEVEATCDRVAFIKEGRVLQTLPLHELESGQLQVELRVDAVTPALLAGLADLPIEQRVVDGAAPGPDGGALIPATTLQLRMAGEDLLPVIAERTLASGARLYALTPRRPSLEEIFLEIVGTEDSGQ
ncbi:MAG TPA: ABC transporter ATP-binding protein [Chloroflexia bacterium]|nr:ABC transporter ATP-binding protein [Chloroflexia bacterium]